MGSWLDQIRRSRHVREAKQPEVSVLLLPNLKKTKGKTLINVKPLEKRKKGVVRLRFIHTRPLHSYYVISSAHPGVPVTLATAVIAAERVATGDKHFEKSSVPGSKTREDVSPVLLRTALTFLHPYRK